MTDDEPTLPRAKFQPPSLDRLGISELHAYLAELHAEIVRTEAEIARKGDHRAAAENVFGTPPQQ